MKQALLISALLSFGSAAAAQPATPLLPSRLNLDQCGDRGAVLAGLAAENQFVLIAADFLVADGNTGYPVTMKFAFTANKDFSSGYQIYSKIDGELCVGKKFYRVILFDTSTGEIDGKALRGKVLIKAPLIRYCNSGVGTCVNFRCIKEQVETVKI